MHCIRDQRDIHAHLHILWLQGWCIWYTVPTSAFDPPTQSAISLHNLVPRPPMSLFCSHNSIQKWKSCKKRERSIIWVMSPGCEVYSHRHAISSSRLSPRFSAREEPGYEATGDNLSYTPSVECVVGWKCETQPASSANFHHFLITCMPCSYEKRYQALPALSNCKQQLGPYYKRQYRWGLHGNRLYSQVKRIYQWDSKNFFQRKYPSKKAVHVLTLLLLVTQAQTCLSDCSLR